MKNNHPSVDLDSTVVEVRRVAHLSLNALDITIMSAREALEEKMFDTSHGTMDVDVIVTSGPHAGARCYPAGRSVRARYNPDEQLPSGRYLWDEQWGTK